MLGYLYYWFACHYYKRAYKADHPVHFPAAVALGAIQFSLVYNAYMVYIMFFPLNMNVAYKTPVTVAVLAVVAVVCWFNYRFYGGKIEVLSKKYKSCALNNKLKGWMMFLFMFGLFLFPLVTSFIVNSLLLRQLVNYSIISVITMFEYIFYRLYLAYKKLEPNTNHGFRASLTISAYQFCMVLCVMLVLRGFFDIYLLPKNIVLAKIIALVFMALLIFYNYKHYTPKIKEMEKKFAKRPAIKWLKDWLFFLLLILTFLSFIFGPFIISNLLS